MTTRSVIIKQKALLMKRHTFMELVVYGPETEPQCEDMTLGKAKEISDVLERIRTSDRLYGFEQAVLTRVSCFEQRCIGVNRYQKYFSSALHFQRDSATWLGLNGNRFDGGFRRGGVKKVLENLIRIGVKSLYRPRKKQLHLFPLSPAVYCHCRRV